MRKISFHCSDNIDLKGASDTFFSDLETIKIIVCFCSCIKNLFKVIYMRNEEWLSHSLINALEETWN